MNDYIALTNANTLGMNGSFTASAWINADTLTSGDHTIFGTDTNGPNIGLHLTIRNHQPYLGFYANDLAGTTVLQTGTWYHITFRFDATTGQQAIFVNGVLDTATTGHAAFAGTEVVKIGSRTGGAFFDGKIDDVTIFNRAITNEEIAKLAADNLIAHSPAKVSLVSYLQGEGDANDARGLNNGTLMNGATTTTDGKIGSAFSFDGVNDFVSLNTPTVYDGTGSQFTVSAWVQTTNSGTAQWILSRAEAGQFQWNVFMRSDGKLQANMEVGSAITIYGKVSTNSFNDGAWHFVTATYDTNAPTEDVRFYVDGVEQNSVYADTRATNNYTASVNTPLRIGARYDGGVFNGRIDEVTAYNRLLSTTEIENQYRSQSRDTNTFVATPVASYKADGDANDFSSTNEGTLNGGVTASSGIAGRAYDFNGTSGYISVPDVAALEVTTQLTLSAWINPDDVSTYRQIISKFGTSGNFAYQIGLAPNGKLRIDLSTDGAGSVFDNISMMRFVTKL